MYATIVLAFIFRTFVWAMIALGTFSFLDLIWEWIT
jgi:hypothetical protein